MRGEIALVARRAKPQAKPRGRARAQATVVPFPKARALGRLDFSGLAPSGRSIATGLLLAALAFGAYMGARTTSVFSVQELAVTGATPAVAAQVRAALAHTEGESLLALRLDALEQEAEAIPTVAGVSFDRAFPHTLEIAVVPERPVAVLRQGTTSWLAAASGRVTAMVDRGARPALPRIWLKRDVQVRVGETASGPLRSALRAVTPLVRKPLPFRVATVRATDTELTFVLRSGLELRLGDRSDLPLKLALARRILPSLAGASGYLDIAVPERPVIGTSLQPQVEIKTQVSTTA